ncbi:hypothetical protein GCM10023083_38370 [Streptomyces phyllanthi]
MPRLLRGLRRRPVARWRGPLVPVFPRFPGSCVLSADMGSSVLSPAVGYPLLSGSGLAGESVAHGTVPTA